MSGGWLCGGVHGWASSKCREGEGEEGQLLSSCIAFGVSTSGGRKTSVLTSAELNSLEAGVDAPSARILHFSVTWMGGHSPKHLLDEAAPSEYVSALLFLIEADCLFGVSRHCALETPLVIWQDPSGWLPASGTTADSAAFLLRVCFGWLGWSLLDLVSNVNEGNLHTLFFLDSWLQPSRMLVAEWHFLLPRLTGSTAATELSNCGLT